MDTPRSNKKEIRGLRLLEVPVNNFQLVSRDAPSKRPDNLNDLFYLYNPKGIKYISGLKGSVVTYPLVYNNKALLFCDLEKVEEDQYDLLGFRGAPPGLSVGSEKSIDLHSVPSLGLCQLKGNKIHKIKISDKAGEEYSSGGKKRYALDQGVEASLFKDEIFDLLRTAGGPEQDTREADIFSEPDKSISRKSSSPNLTVDCASPDEKCQISGMEDLVVQQATNSWCWAAVTRSILRSLGNDTITQCDIAYYGSDQTYSDCYKVGKSNCTKFNKNTYKKDSNKEEGKSCAKQSGQIYTVDQALRKLKTKGKLKAYQRNEPYYSETVAGSGNATTGYDDVLTMSKYLSKGLPLYFGRILEDDSGHAYAVSGYYDGGWVSREYYLSAWDPWPDGMLFFGGGEWTDLQIDKIIIGEWFSFSIGSGSAGGSIDATKPNRERQHKQRVLHHVLHVRDAFHIRHGRRGRYRLLRL
ncbi:MAG: hypothetical protein HZA01_04600 [Nitrospinae bacterium]|nr:hypothetical protein [Nitrospinota bacterium]